MNFRRLDTWRIVLLTSAFWFMLVVLLLLYFLDCNRSPVYPPPPQKPPEAFLKNVVEKRDVFEEENLKNRQSTTRRFQNLVKIPRTDFFKQVEKNEGISSLKTRKTATEAGYDGILGSLMKELSGLEINKYSQIESKRQDSKEQKPKRKQTNEK
uniref:Uncharacterized protein n=1 Tax=Romanomermis culicivorax TaxID=13658 RepID=A0A915I6D5_ROMCU